MSDLILFGMQGSGKGTQAKLLVQKYGYKLFETGEELRKISRSNTKLGEKVKNVMNSGQLVSTEIIMEIIDNFLQNIDNNQKVIFDGIPRSEEQRILFEELMKKQHRTPLALHIKLSVEEALTRLLKRFTCIGVDTTNTPLITEEECINLGGTIKKRSDDNEQAITVRLNTFQDQTIPVINFYQQHNRLIEINGLQDVNDVFRNIEEKL